MPLFMASSILAFLSYSYTYFHAHFDPTIFYCIVINTLFLFELLYGGDRRAVLVLALVLPTVWCAEVTG